MGKTKSSTTSSSSWRKNSEIPKLLGGKLYGRSRKIKNENLFEQRYTILLLLATHSYDHNKTTSSVK